MSTGQLEEAVQGHPSVAECAVVGVADALKGEVPMGLVVLNKGVSEEAAAPAPGATMREVSKSR